MRSMLATVATTDDAETHHAPRPSLTIAGIAHLAGMSAPTVSKVFNGQKLSFHS
jgi:hypothetical protein